MMAMDEMVARELRVVVLPLSPPRRLAPGARFRSLKTMADRQVWGAAWQQVRALVDDGWSLDRVVVDFGRTLPLLPEAIVDFVRALCDLPDDTRVDWEWSGRGRGETRAHLMKHE